MEDYYQIKLKFHFYQDQELKFAINVVIITKNQDPDHYHLNFALDAKKSIIVLLCAKKNHGRHTNRIVLLPFVQSNKSN